MSIHGVLGEMISYPKTYNPAVLFPIDRKIGRDEIVKNSTFSSNILVPQLIIGMDWWHCFELSWLNQFGISQIAMARLAIPADSESIIESKSLKLYLNSLNLTEFESVGKVKKTIENDLTLALKAVVKVEVYNLTDSVALPIAQAEGYCIDEALANTIQKIAVVSDVDASLLAADSANGNEVVVQSYHSHLLRSNCPVTDQPDWGTLQIDIESVKVDEQKLLEYILTYRQHNGFHEQCVEQIFADLTQVFNPSKLMVRAWYTRRGGIDINPCRVSDMSLLPEPSRLVRQ